ncbi:hypothetical protein LTR08_007790 [Meristemomyces frigidus]|nr:hypothetical protein LTR08_007790 [Meristemomyces frigidus]
MNLPDGQFPTCGYQPTPWPQDPDDLPAILRTLTATASELQEHPLLLPNVLRRLTGSTPHLIGPPPAAATPLSGTQMMPPGHEPGPSGSTPTNAGGDDADDWRYNFVASDMFCYQITTFLEKTPEKSIAPHVAPEYITDKLEVAVDNAGNAVRDHPNSFTSTGLSRLIDVVIKAAYASKSSAAADAAVRFLGTAHIHSGFPHGGLSFLRVVRFIAWTYHKTSQTLNTKRVAHTTLEVVTRILSSNLGSQLLEALSTVLGSSEGSEGLAESTGALKLFRELLGSRDVQVKASMEEYLNAHGIEKLFDGLMAAAEASHGLMNADAIDVLEKMLLNDTYVQHIHAAGRWTWFTEVVEHCIARSGQQTPRNHAASQAMAESEALVKRLADMIDPTDTELSLRVSQLFVEVRLPLTDPLLNGLLAIWTTLLRGAPSEWLIGHTKESNKKVEFILTLLGRSTLYADDLAMLVEKTVVFFVFSVQTHPNEGLEEMIAVLQSSAAAPTTAAPMASIMSSTLVRLFEHEISEVGTESLEFKMLFEGLCEVARHSVEAVEILFRIRKDVTGVTYLSPSPRSRDPQAIVIKQDLNLTKWFDSLYDIFQDTVRTREVFEYASHATSSLLGNHILFASNVSYIRALLKTVTDLLVNSGRVASPEDTGLSKTDIAAHLVQILSTITSYHDQLTKQEILALVSTFEKTAGSRGHVVTIQCIHALTICCYEVPALMSSYMDSIINKMSRLVTQQYLGIHILQFLAGLSRLPELYRNFTESDYRRIFGVCASYLQSARGQHSLNERKRTPTSERSSTMRDEEALPEYVYALAHNVITFWYLSSRAQDRQALKTYINGFLTYKDANGKDIIEDQGLVTIDMMDRVDSEPGLVDVSTSTAGTLSRLKASENGLHRVVGSMLVTTKPSSTPGKISVTVRRPSGNAFREVETERVVITVDSGDDDVIPVLPSDADGSGRVTIPRQGSVLGAKTVVTLPQTEPQIDGVLRAIAHFDRTSALDSHKAGVIYIREGQTTADEIFQNTEGSGDYEDLLSNLGPKRRLKGAEFNPQGLDRTDDTDGEFAIVWNNQVTEVVFHVTTMMPNSQNIEQNVSYNTSRKKKHPGNDNVNVIFNRSGSPLDFTTLFNLFPGEPTYVYIVVTPSARPSLVDPSDEGEATDMKNRFYGVKVHAKPAYPNISPAVEEKVVSGASLPAFIRNLVLNDCIISLMWTPRNDSSEYPSSWRSRLDQIRRMRERYGEKKE